MFNLIVLVSLAAVVWGVFLYNRLVKDRNRGAFGLEWY